jgi:murein DD-endopeptidase MepM/ murein hydrolase activator NlpD
MKRGVLVLVPFLVAVVLAAGGAWWLLFERQPPTGELVAAKSSLGRRATFTVAVHAPKSPGLHSVQVVLRTASATFPLTEKNYGPGPLLGGGARDDVVRVDADLGKLGVPEGNAQIEVLADTYGWRLSREGPTVVVEHPVVIDVTPPQVAVLSSQHNIRLGGASVAVFRAVGAERADVVVGTYAFPATRGVFADADAWVGVFAVPQDLDSGARVSVRAIDSVGNASDVGIPVKIKARRFPDRTLALSEAFLQQKVPEIYAANALAAPADLVQGYLFINRELRKQSEERLRALTASSSPRPLWSGAFLRQPNAAPMSAFADRRAYEYRGTIIDRQIHLGYDLASLRHADVIATQNGIVLLADNLGIYGNTVVLDHGLGVFSLYGHLSGVSVQKGQTVKAGAVVGQTGETGLAGGDHLHFSIMVGGSHVDPVEWWDPLWIRDHVAARFSLLPVAPADAGGETAPAAQPAPGATEARPSVMPGEEHPGV